MATAHNNNIICTCNQGRAGEDILRMANNLVRFDNLRSRPRDRIHLLSAEIIDGWVHIQQPESVKVTFIDFIFGKGESSVINRKNLR